MIVFAFSHLPITFWKILLWAEFSHYCFQYKFVLFFINGKFKGGVKSLYQLLSYENKKKIDFFQLKEIFGLSSLFFLSKPLHLRTIVDSKQWFSVLASH